MKVQIDKSRCQATGFCVRVAPGYFKLGDGEGATATALADQIAEADVDAVLEAEDLCPTQAISIITD